MYLSVYLDKNSLPAADFIVFCVIDKSLFFDSYLLGEEKCGLGCTVITRKKEGTLSQEKESKRIRLLYLAVEVKHLQCIHHCALTFN